MRLTSILLLVPALALSSVVVACGDDDSSDGDGAEAGDRGVGGSLEGQGGNSNRAGSGNRAGSSNRGGSSSGGSGNGTNVPGSIELGDIDTDAEAQGACERMAEAISSEEIEAMSRGVCAITGLVASLQGVGECADIQQQCIDDDEDPIGTDDPEQCTPDTFPDCSGVTLDEYIACNEAMMAGLGEITCDTNPLALGALFETIPGECEGPFAACPEMNPLAEE